jgi:hypothetical protein
MSSTSDTLTKAQEWEEAHSFEEWQALPVTRDDLDQCICDAIHAALAIPGVWDAVMSQAHKEDFTTPEDDDPYSIPFYYIWEHLTTEEVSSDKQTSTS